MRQETAMPAGTAIVEWAPFRLAAGVDPQALIVASETLQREFLERQPGFVRRELLHGPDGQWADLVVWRDERTASEAMSAAMSSPVCLAYFHLLEGGDDPATASSVLHFRRIREWPA